MLLQVVGAGQVLGVPGLLETSLIFSPACRMLPLAWFRPTVPRRRGRLSWRCGGFYRLRGMTRTTMRVMMLKIKPRIPNRTAL